MEVRLSVAALQPASLTGRRLITRLLGAKLRRGRRLDERIPPIKCQHHGVFALKHWDYLWRAVYALAAAIQIQIQVTWVARRLFCSAEPGRLGQKASGQLYARVRYYAGQGSCIARPDDRRTITEAKSCDRRQGFAQWPQGD